MAEKADAEARAQGLTDRKASLRSLVGGQTSSLSLQYPHKVDATPPPAEEKFSATKLKLVDANGLALFAVGFSTFMFSAFLLDWTGVNTSKGPHFGFHYLIEMLTWGVSVCLVLAGIVQGLNDDLLGFTSYIAHAAILGTIGYNFEEVAQGAPTSDGGPGDFSMVAYLCYAAFYINLVFSLMAVKIAYMFAVLYVSVALMFLFVGFNFAGVIPNDDERTGAKTAGAFCLIVAIQAFYLMVPVLTGKGFLK